MHNQNRRSIAGIVRSFLGLVLGIALGAAMSGQVAWAQPESGEPTQTTAAAQSQEYAISGGDLGTALDQFAEQSDLQIIYDADLVAGLTAPAVSGRYQPNEILEELLTGSGLEWSFVNDHTLVLRRVQAAPGSSTGPRPGIEEIIVTGQKREERIQDVPIAISAFSAEDLEAQKIEGGFDLLKGVPNVTFSKTNFSGYNFQIRGIGTQAVSATTDPGVAVSFNNTTLIVNRLFEQEYLDIERVEVLRGPQGTLFGRNATGGVINVISAKPQMGVTEGMLKVEAGNFNARRLRGMFNLPIGDEIAIRGAYASTVRDGYGHNEFSAESKDNPFRDPVQADVDDRDLWTGRLTLGWEPNERFRMDLLWERFEEDDRRVRTSKQLCHRDEGPEIFDSVTGANLDVSTYIWSALSTGCKAGSLYADEAFGTPNGASLPYISALFHGPNFASGVLGGLAGAGENFGLGGNPFQGDPGVCSSLANGAPFGDGAVLLPVDVCNPDVYRGRTQSRDLRTISSQLEPQYKADADIVDLSFDYQLSDGLLLSSQTVYVSDNIWATQDYNRFTAFPIFSDSSAACGMQLLPGGFGSTIKVLDCSDDPDAGVGSFADGFYADLSPRPEGSEPTPTGVGGVVCDPQLGCSDTVLIQDLSRAESTQYNQEVRLTSSFDGDWNFSLGANYTRFRTVNDYFVFANTFTHLLNFFPFQSHDSRCVNSSSPESIETGQFDGDFCRYVDPNPLESINGEGHNYFRSGNPYKLRSSAIFGELYWNATDTVKVTTGLRFTWDRKAFTPLPSQLLLGDFRELGFVSEGEGPDLCSEVRTTCVLAGTAPGGRGFLAEPDIVQEWREPTGRLVVDWSPDPAFAWLDETMLYASFARGYKGGGSNPPGVARPAGTRLEVASGGFTAPPTFEPEFINAYEIGTKNTLFSGAVVLNGTAFYYDYTDYQVSKIVDRSAFNENFDAKVWGLELEAVFAPTPDTVFNATIGYLETEIADGEESIDLIDRTDGGNRHFAAAPGNRGSNNQETDFPDGFDDWIVIQPWITAASNCIAPRELVEANFLTNTRNFLQAYCPAGNPAGASVAGLSTAYFTEPDEDGNRFLVGTTASDRNFDHAKDAPNGGRGFAKDLSGNKLPNAPNFTVALGAQQTFHLSRHWSATARVDYYWQDESFARVYNFEPYDRLKSWSNTNLSFWVDRPEWGLRIEGYVKNVFDETPITGTFLNSDDTGLTTNVFTLDPRLIGISVRKEF